jgi:Protein of unknown function (DUF3780)
VKAAPRPTVGFGVPDVTDPHHLLVTVPRGRDEAVLIAEHFGVRAGPEGMPDVVERLELSRGRWTAIAEPLRRAFNERLKEKGLTTGRWVVGDNKVERLLGKELCVLAWAVEKAPESIIPVAVTNWSGLRPEERWWLFTMTAAATGGLEDAEVGWRKALRFALTENPTSAEAQSPKAKRRARRADDSGLSLFDRLASSNR